MTGLTLHLAGPDDTRSLGQALADLCRPGDLLVLDGPLGAGKTVLVQGIGAGLGVSGPVTSPTFVIARVHRDGRIPLVHVDAYRLHGVLEVDDLDLDASTDEAVTVVEWGAGLVEQLADAHLHVTLSRTTGGSSSPPVGRADDDARTAVLDPVGGDWAERLGRLPSG